MPAKLQPLAANHATDHAESWDAIICDLSAIPEDQREAHFALARSLLFAKSTVVHDVEDGLAFDVPPDRLADVAAFLDNERKCCRHLTFTLEIPPRNAPLRLRVNGPGARDELEALVR